MSNIQKQHKISPAIAWLTIQKFIIFYCPLDGEHTNIRWRYFLDGLPVLGGCLIDDTHKHLRVMLGVCKSDLQSNLRQCQISSLH